jgi:type IV secretory pathway VirB10-like protein
MRHWVIVLLVAVAVIGCAETPTPAPTAEATSAPVVLTVAPTNTAAPSPTPLPPTPTAAPTNTAAPTDTPAPTNTPLPTPTNTRRPVTLTPKPTPTNPAPTAVSLKYSAPQLVEPKSGDTRISGKDDLIFKWSPVADLGEKECYLVTVQVINLADPAQHYAQASYLAKNTCNSFVSGGTLSFTLPAKKHGPPDYEGLVAIASQTTPSNFYTARWWVTVVRDDGPDPNNTGVEKTTPLSPESEKFEFSLQSP